MIDSPTAQPGVFIPQPLNQAKQEEKPCTQNNIPKGKPTKRGYVETIEEKELWDKVRDDYINNSDMTLEKLALKHKVNYATLKGRKARGQWNQVKENTIKPITNLRDDKQADDEMTLVRLTIKRTALEACNTILGIMRGTITKNASIRASTAQDMLDRAGFKTPDNIGQKLQAYTELVKSITINVGTVVNQAISETSKTKDIQTVEAKVVENVSADVSDNKCPASTRATLQEPTTTGGSNDNERLISNVMLTKQPLPVDIGCVSSDGFTPDLAGSPTEQDATNIPEITDSSDTEGALSPAPDQDALKDSGKSRYRGAAPL